MKKILLFIPILFLLSSLSFSGEYWPPPPPALDEAYDSTTWDGSKASASRNAIRDIIEEINIINSLLEEINGGVPNSESAMVDWSQLANVPTGFADGSDATGSITGFYVFNSLTGGTADDLDSLEIDADSLAAGYLAYVGDISSGTGYFYQLIEDTDAEVEPYFIRPGDYDTAATKMVWKLLTGLGLHPTSTSSIILRDADAPKTEGGYEDHMELKVNCTDPDDGEEDCDVELWQFVAGEATLAMRFDADGVIETSKAIAGGVNVKSESDATYTVGTDNALESYGTIFVNGDNDPIAFTLDTAVVGKNMCFKQGTGVSGAITVTAGAGDRLKQEDGTALTVATAYASAGAAGDWLCIYAEDDTYWQISRESGEWGE
jgi:hypothetical protein